ncbi:interferon alpha-inducible protein 27-like protein 2b [Gigaspora margarita]|uniref:Interferon alpha-inducible protein 27-like protein 2b n=1 Tax=Gigaspora margarita TaxID=4874 RepID=A0A8H4EHX9_GIGMA|nr:interferon alpha-inducible protein 27-like protein 2b [Gigaspora margarita]
MVQVPDSKFFKGALLDSFEQKGYVYSKSPPATEPSPPSNFLNFLKKTKNSIANNLNNLSAPAPSPSPPAPTSSPPAPAPSPPAPAPSPPSNFLKFLEKTKNSIVTNLNNLSAPAPSPSPPAPTSSPPAPTSSPPAPTSSPPAPTSSPPTSSPPTPAQSPPSNFLKFLEKTKNSIGKNLNNLSAPSSAPAPSPSEPSSSPFLKFLDNTKKFIGDHKKIITISAFTIGGLVLTPIIVVGLIEAIGFGAGGIAAGSFAAWLMSLNGGATAAGSLVAILQSIGAAGLTAGATVGTGTAGATVMAGLGKLLAERLDSNHEGQAQLDEFIKVYDEGNEDEGNEDEGNKDEGNKDEGNEDKGNEDERNEDKNSKKGSTTVVFEIRDKLLNNDEAFDNFLETFTLTYNASKQLVNKKQQFKFFVDETCVIDKMDIAEKKLETLNDHLVTNYGAECVDKQVQSRTIMLNCNNS